MLLALLSAGWLLQAPAPSPAAPAPEPPVEIAKGIHLIRGAVVPGRGPDGNTILIDAPNGLIVVDTGRHTYHSDAILAFARDRKRPIAAIVNTHWHLDHSSGNMRLKAAHPKARVYTTTAIDRALAPGGFLTRNLESTKQALPETADALRKEEMQIFITTMGVREHLRPDVPLTKSGSRALAGRTLDVRVTDRAVSDADVWLYDAPTRVAVVGDLITMPVPFFETACPNRWRAALDEVWATPFETTIPGHGRPMTRADFDTYRKAFGAFVECAGSNRTAAQCGTAWADGIGTLLGDDLTRRRAVAQNIEYYVGYLRSNGGKAPDCLAQ
jgi:glyoxylase-like metal-dependent hydrolase (beta-lactamase superfamily II)